MTCVMSKSLLFFLTCGCVWYIMYLCFIKISLFKGTVNILDDKLITQPKKKFVAILSKTNEIKMVYIDNDNMDDVKEIPDQNSTTNTSGDVASMTSYYVSSSVGTENPYSIEWDETIDYNYEKPVSDESNRLMDATDKPKHTIVLVQEHHHSNIPITNIMYRYGDLNQLTFALPKKPTFQTYWPLRFHPSFVDTSLTFTSHVNMLINPSYRYETLRRFMPKDTVFIAVLHDPVKTFFSKLIKHPGLRRHKLKTRLKIIRILVERNKIFEDKYYANSMAFQFGYPKKHENHNLTSKEILDELKTQFDIVLMGDYLDESLVVLRKFLNWSLTDFVHVSEKKNVNFSHVHLTTQLQDAIKEHNNLDVAIYEHFNNTFWKAVESYGPTFTSDLKQLQSLNRKLTNFCNTEGHFGITTNTDGDTVCKRMNWGDVEYVSYLKLKSQVIANTELNTGLQYLKNSLEQYFNTTSKEIQRYLDN